MPPRQARTFSAVPGEGPKKRLRDIGDAEALLEDRADAGQRPGGRLESPPHKSLAWIAAAVLAAVAAIAGVGWWRATRPAELKPLVRLDVDLGGDVSPGPNPGINAIISPDGTRLVYVSQGRLFTRRMDQPKAVELAGTEAAVSPFFSPDGQWVAFFATQEQARKRFRWKAARPSRCALPVPASSGSWGEDGNIIATLAVNVPLSPDSLRRGTGRAPVTEFGQGEATHRWPQILPGGKAVMFTAHNRNSSLASMAPISKS